MNTNSILTAAALLTALTSGIHAQGSLTPPAGPPVASMRTLDQVEARTPLVAGAPGVAISAAGTITISLPGSYYLTKNITITTNVDGLVINADATVDMNGFSIIGTAAAITTADAIVVATTVNATIRNGIIKGGTTLTGTTYSPAGFDIGLFATFPPTDGRSSVTVQDLTVTGVRSAGIFLRRASRVERCMVQGVGGNGIDAAQWNRPDTAPLDPRLQSQVRDCHASDCGGQFGIGAGHVSGSFGHTNRAGSAYSSASCGILAVQVEHSTGWATGMEVIGIEWLVFGIHGFSVSHCSGRGTSVAIAAAHTAIACIPTGAGSVSAPQKHLGTP